MMSRMTMSNGRYVLNAQGDPVEEPDLLTWAKWFETAERHVADDKVGDVRVSTVFLGCDHSFSDGPPILFETLVFGGPLDGEMDRYRTRDEALVGHAAMLRKVVALGDPPEREQEP